MLVFEQEVIELCEVVEGYNNKEMVAFDTRRIFVVRILLAVARRFDA